MLVKIKNKQGVNIIVFLSIITPIFVMNSLIFNGVMPMVILLPALAVIVAKAVEKKLKTSALVSVLGFIFLVSYFSLPSYTVGESETKILLENNEIIKLERSHNTPIYREKYNPFDSRAFYTFRATEKNGKEYNIIFNPDTGEFFYE